MAYGQSFTGTTDNLSVDTLIGGTRWFGGPISYSTISGLAGGAALTTRQWTDAEKLLVSGAIANIEAITNAKFTNALDASQANVQWAFVRAGVMPTATVAVARNPSTDDNATGPPAICLADPFTYVLENPANSDPDAVAAPAVTLDVWAFETQPGSFGYNVALRVLGQAIGLASANVARPNGLPALYGLYGTYTALEIAALQHMYGANMTAHTGNDIYTLPETNGRGTAWSCLWDAAGIDAISNLGSNIACTIDLRAASLTGSNPAGYVSRATGIAGGFTIANGVTIEQAYGGLAGDVLIGNDADNRLDGSYGADTMAGGRGGDTYVVENARDVVNENSSEGVDTVRSLVNYTLGPNVENLLLLGSSPLSGEGNTLANVMTGNPAANFLYGKEANDTIFGMGGNDVLDGGAGNDSLVGGAGNDTYVIDSKSDVTLELPGEGTDTVRAFVSYTLGAEVENLVLQDTATTGTGNNGDNMLTGTDRANALYGMDGADTLDGGGGGDLLVGGAGNDTYKIYSGSDRVKELAGQEIDTVMTLIDYTLGSEVENLVLLPGATTGTGNSLANVLTGNGADNTLYGGGGNDTLIGGAGNDSLWGGAGNDIFVFTRADFGPSPHDEIFDFSVGDRLDFSAVFRPAMLDVRASGALQYTVTGDWTGDGVIDFTLIVHTIAVGLPDRAFIWA